MRLSLHACWALAATMACGGGPTAERAPSVAAAATPLLVPAPPSAGQPAPRCQASPALFAGTAIADRESWYGQHLRALGEPVLCVGSDTTREVYRLTWLPSFHHSVIVRVERVADGYRLEAKVETGAGGYAAGTLARDTAYVLPAVEQGELALLMDRAQPWAIPTTPPPTGGFGADGAQWVLELLAGGRYHVIDRWSPHDETDARFRALAEWMLARSGMAPDTLVREY